MNNSSFHYGEYRIPGLYLLFGFLWIILSDRLLAIFVNDPAIITQLQTYKGWAFVFLSTLLIFFLLRYHLSIQHNNQVSILEREEKYRLLFDNSLDAILLSAMDGTILAANQAACGIFQMTEAELLSRSRDDLLDQSDPRIAVGLNERAKTGRYSGEWTFIRKNGQKFVGEISMALYKDGLGQDRSGIFIRDITGRKEAEDALRLHSAALNSAVNAIVITDAKGTVEWANPSFSMLSGYPLDEVLGQNLGKLVTSGKQDAAYYSQMWKTISSGKIWRGEIINRRKDGSLYYEEEAITPVFDQNNNISHYVAIKQDITDRKNSERLLYESEERLQLALQAANQGLYDLNFQTGEIVVNDTYFRMLGYDPLSSTESVESWAGRLHPDDRTAIDSTFYSILNGESNEFREEFRERAQNGEWKWILSVGKTVERDTAGKPLRMVGTRTDISETKSNSLKISRLLEESNLRLRRLAALREIDQAISSNFFLNSTLTVLVEQVKNQLQVDGVSVLLFDDTNQSFFLAASDGIHRNPGSVRPISIGDSLAGKAAFEGKVIHLEDLMDPSIDERLKAFLVDEGFVDYFGSPINAKGKLKGVIEVFHRTPTKVDEEWMSFFATLSGQAAVAIENAQLFESLQNASQNLLQAYDATIKGWSMAMDLRDHETEGHTERVTEMTITIARRMNFTEEEIVHIRRGTLLHDIGKMGVPDSILLKPEPLTPQERSIIEQHPQYAYEMLKSIDYLRPALTIPHLHHERWDGSGYPDGLKGLEIPLEARLFAVVDVFDALTSDRPYRSCWSQEAALKHIQDEAGHHFDPEIVRIFTEYLASGVKFGC